MKRCVNEPGDLSAPRDGRHRKTRWIADRRGLLHFTLSLMAGLAVSITPVHAAGNQPSAPTTKPPTSNNAAALVLVVGDSLSAEYGLRRGSGWVALLEEQLRQDKLNARVINASVSGDTTSGGRSRLPALLAQHHPTVVVLELGSNDALRGLPLSMTQANLNEMAQAAKAAGARVLVVGMQVPPNYGRQYTEDFAKLFEKVAQTNGAGLVPILLKNVGDSPQADQLFQSDRLHPNEKAQPLLLANVWPALKPLLTPKK